MRVLVLVKASEESEAGWMPDEQMLTDMGRFNEELANAGILQVGEGLQPSSAGKRVRFDTDQKVVIDGPFSETQDLVSGFWIWRVDSMEQAVDWLKKAPFGGGAEIEIRPVSEAEGFGPEGSSIYLDG
jgi:hypothetical protein